MKRTSSQDRGKTCCAATRDEIIDMASCMNETLQVLTQRPFRKYTANVAVVNDRHLSYQVRRMSSQVICSIDVLG